MSDALAETHGIGKWASRDAKWNWQSQSTSPVHSSDRERVAHQQTPRRIPEIGAHGW